MHLIELINSGSSDIITSIINKFNTVENSGLKNYSRDLFVLIDESHRSNYGTLSTKMRTVFPNACYIGFTGTPLMKVEKSTMERFGKIDILINNAGTGAVAPAEEITDEQFKHEMEVDLFGTFVCAREVGKEMIKAGYGRIINIASMYGLVGNMIAGSSPYHAAKGGVVNLTRALAAEWGKYGVTVNSICPGYFYTDLTTATLDSDYFQAIAKRSIPLERYGREGELDTCALFLASPMSTYVNGQNIAVDGGYTSI